MRRRDRFRVFLVVGLLASCGCGTEPRDDARRTNVLLVTLDTLRADRLGSYGYGEAGTPHLDALADRGLRFSRATTVTPLTLPAHASLLTGTYPAFHGVRDNGGFYLDEQHTTLAEILASNGFRTGGFVGAFVLDSRWGIAQGFERFFDDFDLGDFEQAAGMDAIQRSGKEVVDQALEWLRRDDDRPFFAWVHLYDPHTPYAAPEPYRSRFPATRSGAYDAEIAWTDAQVGRLLLTLENDGRLENTLVVVAGDHGEMLGEHGEITHGFFIYEAATRIPLILAGPGVPRAEVTSQVRIIDVFPTLLASLGIEPPDVVHGVDLAPLARGERLRLLAHSENWFPRFHYGWSDLASIQDGRYKLIRAPRSELYDLEADPSEKVNLATEQAGRAARMEEALEELLAEISSDRAPVPQALDEETARRLQALGYLDASTSRRHLEKRPRGDPKDKIGLYNLLKQAAAASSAGDLDHAIAKVRQALVEDPDIVEAHVLEGNFERKRQGWNEAAAAYGRALALDPEHHEALFSLAVTYKEMGRYEDALAGLERAADLDPRSGRVIWETADVLMRQRRFAEAERRLLAALALDLDRARFLLKLAECQLERKRPAEAEKRAREALTADPDLATAHFTLGLALEEQGRPEAAIAAYRAELDANDRAYRASFNLAKLLLAGGRPRQAEELFARTIEIRPDFGTGHLYLAKARLDLGNLEGAAQAARDGLERHPTPEIAPLGHYVLADVYNRQGMEREAAREIAAARRLESSGGG